MEIESHKKKINALFLGYLPRKFMGINQINNSLNIDIEVKTDIEFTLSADGRDILLIKDGDLNNLILFINEVNCMTDEKFLENKITPPIYG